VSKHSIIYFNEGGDTNTDDVIEIIRERLKSGDIKSVVVASSSGKTALKFAGALGKSTKIVIAATKPGSKEPGVWSFDQETFKKLQDLGIPVIKQAHALAGLERSFTEKFSGISRTEVVAETLRTLFGHGTKVAVEVAIMALDAGEITLGKTIAVGGTGRKGGGADTALVVLPSYTNTFFDFRVLEILTKPFENSKD
jgi:uncharacterized protein